MNIFSRWIKAWRGPDALPSVPQPTEPLHYDLVTSLLTDVGCHREVNEDNATFVRPSDPERLAARGVLALVADGMGGHAAGEVASRLAVETISRVYYESPAASPREALAEAFRAANEAIYRQARGDAQLQGMGTTCTALVLKDGLAYSAHVGDSRLYLVRDGQIRLLSEDHSLVMDMVRRGLINLEEARRHEDKNVILRALGIRAEVEIATWPKPFSVEVGDAFLLCSDGLYDLIEDAEIGQLVRSMDPHGACEALVALARQRGGYDNITVGILGLFDAHRERNAPARDTREDAVCGA